MDVVEGETGSSSETGVTCDVEPTVEVYIKVEDTIDISNETPEAVTSPPIKNEQEVRLWGVCVRWWQLMLLGHLGPPKKGNCAITFNYFLLCVVLWVPYSF
jgi:hypothetical protein